MDCVTQESTFQPHQPHPMQRGSSIDSPLLSPRSRLFPFVDAPSLQNFQALHCASILSSARPHENPVIGNTRSLTPVASPPLPLHFGVYAARFSPLRKSVGNAEWQGVCRGPCCEATDVIPGFRIGTAAKRMPTDPMTSSRLCRRPQKKGGCW